MSPPNFQSLKKTARDLRKKILELHFVAKSSHIGTALSEIDLLTYLFGYFLKPTDRFVLSKGHGASGVYAALDYFSLMPNGMIETYYQDGTKLAAHPSPLALEHLPVATGSLGHGGNSPWSELTRLIFASVWFVLFRWAIPVTRLPGVLPLHRALSST